MASWAVLASPARPGSTETTDVDFVRDGFSAIGFLFPPLWLLWQRLWVEAAVTFAVLLAATALESATGVATSSLISLLVSIFVGLEGNGMRIAALQRRGWRLVDVIEASSAEDAEIRFAAATQSAVPESRPEPTVIVPSRRSLAPAPASPGLLLNPGL